jgi:signal peptidase II
MNPRLFALTLATGVFALDRATKLWIETRMTMMDVHPVIPGFFDIVHAQNSGAAFSMFAGSDSPWRGFLLIGVTVVALVFIAGMLWQAAALDRPTRVALSLIFGGAAGNLFDRVAKGTVTDFLDFYVGSLHWPAFNLADSAIVVGSGLLLLTLLRPKRQAGANLNAS